MGGLVDLYGQRVRQAGRLGVVQVGTMAGVGEDSYKAISDKIAGHYQFIAALVGPGGGSPLSKQEEASVSAQDWRNAIASIQGAAAGAPFNVADLDASLLKSYTSAGYLATVSQADALSALSTWQGMLDADYAAAGGAASGGAPVVRYARRDAGGDGGGSAAASCWPGYGLKDGACEPTPTAYAGGAVVGAVVLAAIGYAIKGTSGAYLGAAVGAAAGAGGVYAASKTEAAKKPR